MKDGDFIQIDYVGKVTESGEVFDLTKEDLAKEKGIYSPNIKYGPIPVIIGGNFVVKGLENGLKEMDVGNKKTITIKPEDAFGERDARFVKLIPLAEFKKQDITPYPGMPVTISRLNGRVISMSGGRVRVDFNHPLAGKTIEYEVEIKNLITDVKEKINAILSFYLKFEEKDVTITIDKETVEINIKVEASKLVKKTVADTIKKWISETKKVRFVDEY
jgi:FKBP-type peptidyl-prolyl cis-trans isomerase 2